MGGPRYAVAIIMGIGYGISISSMDDEFIQHVDHAVESVFQSGGPAAMLIDFFPIRACHPRLAEWHACPRPPSS